MVFDSDFKHKNSVKSNEIHKSVEEVERHSFQSISKNGLSPDEIFANDPFFKSEPDFNVEFRCEDKTGKQIF